MQYTVIFEQGETSWGAYVPDLPGCVAAGESREDVLQLIREAIAFHIDGLRANDEDAPNHIRPASWSRSLPRNNSPRDALASPLPSNLPRLHFQSRRRNLPRVNSQIIESI